MSDQIIYFLKLLFLIYMCILMSVWLPDVCSNHGGQEKASASLELELTGICVQPSVYAGNQTWVPHKSSRCSYFSQLWLPNHFWSKMDFLSLRERREMLMPWPLQPPQSSLVHISPYSLSTQSHGPLSALPTSHAHLPQGFHRPLLCALPGWYLCSWRYSP